MTLAFENFGVMGIGGKCKFQWKKRSFENLIIKIKVQEALSRKTLLANLEKILELFVMASLNSPLMVKVNFLVV